MRIGNASARTRANLNPVVDTIQYGHPHFCLALSLNSSHRLSVRTKGAHSFIGTNVIARFIQCPTMVNSLKICLSLPALFAIKLFGQVRVHCFFIASLLHEVCTKTAHDIFSYLLIVFASQAPFWWTGVHVSVGDASVGTSNLYVEKCIRKGAP